MYTYEQLRPAIDTGDLVLFSGKDGVSTGIKELTKSKWSHIGMALRLSGWDMVLVWESTVSNRTRDVEWGQRREGVQLTLLSTRIADYEGDVALRHLEVERTSLMEEAVRDLRQELRGRPYERRHMELFRSAYDGPFGENEEDLSSLFCSELVAEAYQRMGLLTATVPSNEYTPRDFAAESGLALLKGRLGPELPIRK